MERIEYKTKMVEQKTPYITRTYCDRCKKLVLKQIGGAFLKEYTGDIFSVSYYSVTTGHHDWGNDSIDSIETKVICRSCLTEEYADYVKRTSAGSNTEYIEINHECKCSMPLNEESEE